MTTQKRESASSAEFTNRATEAVTQDVNDAFAVEESVVDGVDRMRDEGGIAPEIPHTDARVDVQHGTVNPQ